MESGTCKEGLQIFYTNADNLLNKLDDLKVRVQLNSFDIIVVTEVYPKTGSSKDVLLSELQIEGYNIYRANEKDHSRVVVIYVSHISYPISNLS